MLVNDNGLRLTLNALKSYLKKELNRFKRALLLPNWNQNDQKATDYIKNRTHWRVDKRALVCELKIENLEKIRDDIAYLDYIGQFPTAEFDSGGCYDVEIDGVAYTNITLDSSRCGWACYAYMGSDPFAGCKHNYRSNYYGESKYPFFIYCSTSKVLSKPFKITCGFRIALRPDITAKTIKIYRHETTFHKLPDEYLPNDLLRFSKQKLTDEEALRVRQNIKANPSAIIPVFFNKNGTTDDIRVAQNGDYIIEVGDDLVLHNNVCNKGMRAPIRVLGCQWFNEQTRELTLLDGKGQLWLVVVGSYSSIYTCEKVESQRIYEGTLAETPPLPSGGPKVIGFFDLSVTTSSIHQVVNNGEANLYVKCVLDRDTFMLRVSRVSYMPESPYYKIWLDGIYDGHYLVGESLSSTRIVVYMPQPITLRTWTDIEEPT